MISILLSISLTAELLDPTLMLCLHFEIVCVRCWLRGVSAAVCRLPLARRVRATLLPAHGLLGVAASPVAERRLLGRVVVPGLSSASACGIFLDQGLNPCPLQWQVGSYLLFRQDSPHTGCTMSHFYERSTRVPVSPYPNQHLLFSCFRLFYL